MALAPICRCSKPHVEEGAKRKPRELDEGPSQGQPQPQHSTQQHFGKVLALVLPQVEAAHRDVPKGHGRLTLNKTECAGGAEGAL